MIAKELHRYNIDIAALQETRLEGEGQVHWRYWSLALLCDPHHTLVKVIK